MDRATRLQPRRDRATRRPADHGADRTTPGRRPRGGEEVPP
ncbi:hypothetical protein [Wenjunlia vitaminophila]|nr:hypothetical protein [Wenjunlia vitaminophila]